MIKVTFHKIHGTFVGFDVKGHADFEENVDRVCTAVSVLASHTVKSITEKCDNLGEYDRGKGYMHFRVKEEDDERSCMFIEVFFNSLKDLEQRFPSSICVEVMNHGS